MASQGHRYCSNISSMSFLLALLLLATFARTSIEEDATSYCSQDPSNGQWTVTTTVTFTAPTSNTHATEEEECATPEARGEKAETTEIDPHTTYGEVDTTQQITTENYETIDIYPNINEGEKGTSEVIMKPNIWDSYENTDIYPNINEGEKGTADEVILDNYENTAQTFASENGYRLFEGLGYYKLHTEKKEWSEANQTCEDEGGHLVIINSKEEELALISIIRGKVSTYDFVFIGINDIEEEGKFVTVLGEPFSSVDYANWASGEPNDGFPGEDCGSMRTSGKINDFFCDAKRSFICEIPLAYLTYNTL